METSICNTYFMSGKIKEFKKKIKKQSYCTPITVLLLFSTHTGHFSYECIYVKGCRSLVIFTSVL